MFGLRSPRAFSGALFAFVLVLGVAMAAAGLPGGSALAAGDCTVDPAQDVDEQAFLQLINGYRAQNALPPLALSYELSKASQWKSNDMAANDYFAHDDATRTWDVRIRDCGYGYNAWLGENIAAGQQTAQSVFDAWRNSAAHNANMLGVNYTAIGIGKAYVASSSYGWYWTTDFGSASDGWPAGTPTATRTPVATLTPPPTAVLTPIPVPTIVRTPIPNCYGDVNHDGSVNSTDRLIVSRHYTSAVAYDIQYDVNRDGRVNSTDLMLVSRYPTLCASV